MMWLWWLLAVPAVLVAGAAIVGMFLPKRFRTTTSITLRKPPDVVWSALADGEKLPVSGSPRKVERLEAKDGQPTWREELGSTTLVVRTSMMEPPRRLVREMRDEKIPMRTRWEYTLEPSDGGTIGRLVEEGEIDSGAWQSPFFRVIMRLAPGAGPRAHLNALARQLGDPGKAK